ncbi:MAG TPA: VTT domain-containing protein [Acidimicrobiales bacterium]|nr:VTT domain-containing protein [Acidimicrobiales bacterium]
MTDARAAEELDPREAIRPDVATGLRVSGGPPLHPAGGGPAETLPPTPRRVHAALAAVLAIRGVAGHLALPLLLAVRGLPFLGVLLVKPGEVTAIVAGAQVRDDRLPFAFAVAALATGAVMADVLGWTTGRLWGTGALAKLGRHGSHGGGVVGRAQRLVHNRGTLAVAVARPTVVTHGIVPVLAGTAGMTLRRFVPASLIGAVAWAALFVGGGAGLGAAWSAMPGVARFGVVGVVVGALCVYGGVRLTRRVRRPVPVP